MISWTKHCDPYSGIRQNLEGVLQRAGDAVLIVALAGQIEAARLEAVHEIAVQVKLIRGASCTAAGITQPQSHRAP